MLASRRLAQLIRHALQEDVGRGDLTTHVLAPDRALIRARVIAKAPGVLAGADVASKVFKAADRRIRCRVRRRDGQPVRAGQTILTLAGSARGILAAERTALNFLGHLSGIATLTRQFVQRAKPSPAVILDTRKTLPGLRELEKYAVRMGGGKNHRLRLDDAVLIKTNHLRALRSSSPQSTVHRPQLIAKAVAKAKRLQPKRFIEVEVTNLREFREAMAAQPDAILLDNWSPADIRRAVRFRSHVSCLTSHVSLLEVSGGVTLRNVRRIAATGVDRISIGTLTHSAPSLDVSLQVVIP